MWISWESIGKLTFGKAYYPFDGLFINLFDNPYEKVEIWLLLIEDHMKKRGVVKKYWSNI